MKKSAILSLASLLLATGCVDSLNDYNVDPKNASVVPGVTLVSSAELGLARNMSSISVNSNVFELIEQYWAETTYPDETTYNFDTRQISRNFWRSMYLSNGSTTPTVPPGVLLNLSEAKRLITADNTLDAAVKANQLACAEVLAVYAWSVLVDTYGNIPYSEALDAAKPQPKYDDAATIYTDLFTRLNAAITSMNTASAGLGSADIIYGGSMTSWKRFANSLKLRMAITTADANAANSKTQAEQAATSGVFTSNEQQANFAFASVQPNTNPIWEGLIQSGRRDFVGTTTFVNQLKTLSDPRLPLYFQPTIAGANKGTYSGGTYGIVNVYTLASLPGAPLESPTFPGVLASYSEVEFLLAEAVERGFNVGGTAAAHYNAAVTASITYWGNFDSTNGSSYYTAAAATYLAQPSVAYTTATGTYKQKIGTQKWIAEYIQPVQAWTDQRRLDYPALVAPSTALSGFPVRLKYPTEELSLNAANYTTAAAAIGGDKVETKLFWDKF
ncbi:MAG: SusD/RagB family nutrient-binding outer membrane lipoprotein [Janthinobacterium lividum]